jgi:hypothetical protein
MLTVLKIWLRGRDVRRNLAVLTAGAMLLPACGVASSLTAAQAGVIGRPAQVIASVAARQANRWATDAFIIGAEGYNLDQSGRLRNLAHSRWDFTFMAANRAGNLVVTVPGRGNVSSALTAPVWNAFQPLYPGANWKIDSDKAAVAARKALGSTAPDDRIDRIILGLNRPDGRRMRPVWEVVPDSGQRSVFIDAGSGAQVN